MYYPPHGGVLARVAYLARHAATTPWLSLVLLVGVVLDDLLLLPRASSRSVFGVLDELAHLATSVVLLSAITVAARRRGVRVPGAFAVGLVVAGNAVDVDHLPEAFGSDVLTVGTPRPYPHSLLTLVIVTAGWLVARHAGRRRAAALGAGLAVGVAGHLLRDLGTSAVALLWPISDRGFLIPRSAYLGFLALATGVVCRGRRGVRCQPDRERGCRREPVGEPRPGAGHGPCCSRFLTTVTQGTRQ
jgi:hypothetical protein